jgi:hypothetical protein
MVPQASKTGLCRSVERVDHICRYTAPRRHVVTITASPLPNRGALLTINRCAPAARARPAAPTTTNSPSLFDPDLEIVAKLLGILRRQIYLVGHTVKAEFDRLIRGCVAVKIIDQRHGYFLGHFLHRSF